MTELSGALAKIYLEKRGVLVSLDLPYEEGGIEAPGFDLVGIELVQGMLVQAVAGVVRGWWHAGSYLTPGLIRSHLQTERRFLSEAFSSERMRYLRKTFGLGNVPIRNILFFSQKSPGKSEEAEKILASMSIEVVYLEDVILELLPLVGNENLGGGTLPQFLSMIRYSRMFREFRSAVRDLEKCRDVDDKNIQKPEARSKQKQQEQQLTFLGSLIELKEDDDGDETR